jgi:LPXTG-motif cell wall-anchored protein
MNMKTIGIVIVIIGLGMTLFTAITYFARDKVAEVGAFEITSNQPHNFSWSPFLGMAIMVVGAFFILRSRKNQ